MRFTDPNYKKKQKQKNWSMDEILLLKSYSGTGITNVELMPIFNRTADSIRRIANKHGFKIIMIRQNEGVK